MLNVIHLNYKSKSILIGWVMSEAAKNTQPSWIYDAHVLLWELQTTKLLVMTLQIDLQRYTLNNTYIFLLIDISTATWYLVKSPSTFIYTNIVQTHTRLPLDVLMIKTTLTLPKPVFDYEIACMNTYAYMNISPCLDSIVVIHKSSNYLMDIDLKRTCFWHVVNYHREQLWPICHKHTFTVVELYIVQNVYILFKLQPKDLNNINVKMRLEW